MKINPKSEKGAITLIVLTIMLFLVLFLVTLYIGASNKAQISAETTKQIEEKYNNIEDANAIYDNYFANTDIIPIYTKEQLAKIGSGEQVVINGKIYTFSQNAYYTLQNNIDLGGVYNEDTNEWSGEQWTPLTSEFTGTLDGFGKTISGIYINDSTAINQGLFGTLNGTVKNLNIENGFIKANEYVGSIAGNLGTNGSIQNCYNTASIIGNTNVTGGYFKSITTGELIEVWGDNVLEENAFFVSGEYAATAPKGFKVSKNVFEQTIEDGMVIQDVEENEFVWIPVTDDIESSYLTGDNFSEPTELTYIYNGSNAAYDSQETLNNRFGTNYFTYSEDFTYLEEYAEMVEQVNDNNGFYIGRYETTIDSKRKYWL